MKLYFTLAVRYFIARKRPIFMSKNIPLLQFEISFMLIESYLVSIIFLTWLPTQDIIASRTNKST